MTELLVRLPEELAEEIIEADEGRLASPSRDIFEGTALGAIIEVVNSGSSVVTVAVATAALPKVARRIGSAIRGARSDARVTITIDKPGQPRCILEIEEGNPQAPGQLQAFIQTHLTFPDNE